MSRESLSLPRKGRRNLLSEEISCSSNCDDSLDDILSGRIAQIDKSINLMNLKIKKMKNNSMTMRNSNDGRKRKS